MLGFNNRIFLTKAEWETYLKRMPVRYIKKEHSEFCKICGKRPTVDNPLQHSHIIGFISGIRNFALTPDYLDSHQNIVSAHRKTCNKLAELSVLDVITYLNKKKLHLPKFIKTNKLAHN